jgi:hypothetical protein
MNYLTKLIERFGKGTPAKVASPTPPDASASTNLTEPAQAPVEPTRP